MADPKPYTRGYSFTNYQADVPDQPLPGNRLDVELDNIAEASSELTARVNAGIDVSINNEALEAVGAEIGRVVFVADNMDTVRDVAEIGPNLELAVDLFLGALANDPATAADGSALAIGATYYNTLIGESRVWAGPASGWIPVAKVSTGGVLQGGTTVAGGAREFMVGDYVSIMLARNGLVLEPGTDFTMTSPTVTVPAAQDGDRLSWFAILKGTPTDAASFVRHTVLTTAGRTTYTLASDGSPLNLTQTNHVLFGGSPFGMLTYGVDYTAADGALVLGFAPEAGELFHIFSMPRFTNSEAQAVLQDFREGVADDIAAVRALVVNVRDFGAAGDGTTNDSAAFQAAADAVADGIVIVPPGDYRIRDIRVRSGTVFDCRAGSSQVTTAASGNTATAVRFRYNGSGGIGSRLFTFKAGTDGQWLKGGGIIGRPHLSGENVAEILIDAQSTHGARFDIEMSRAVFAGMSLNGQNGVLSQFNTVDFKYVWGAQAAVENSHGLILNGNHPDGVNFTGCTQNYIWSNGAVKNGDMVRMVGHCDNNHLWLHATQGAGTGRGTGRTLAALQGNSGLAARINHIHYVCGRVFLQVGSYGNHIDFMTSEGASIAGGGQYSVSRLFDYITGKVYASPAAPLTEYRFFGAAELMPTGAAIKALVAGTPVILMPKSGNGGAAISLHGPAWGAGRITGVEWLYRGTTGNVLLQGELTASAEGQGLSVDLTFTETAPVSGGNITRRARMLDTALPASGFAALHTQRLPANAADTMAGNLDLVGVNIRIDFDGPASLESAVPAWRETN